MECNIYIHSVSVIIALKTKARQFDNFVVIIGTVICHDDNYGSTTDDTVVKLNIISFHWEIEVSTTFENQSAHIKLPVQRYGCVLWVSWWRHRMETFSTLLALNCSGNSPVTGEFPTLRPVSRSFDVFFDLRLNKRLNKQSWGWWFETPSCSLWRNCYDKGCNVLHFCHVLRTVL